MSIENIEVDRVYRCCNKECEGIIAVKQTATEDFLKTCPFCEQEELVIDTAKLSLDIFFDMSKPKTFGSQSDLNVRRREKEEGVKKKNKPWYRQDDKVNFNILKNPKKYIMEGTV